MSIEASVKALHKKIDLAKLRAEKRVTAYVEERVKVIFTDLVKHTPQFTGDLASNWYIEFGKWVGTSGFETEGYPFNYVSEAYDYMENKPFKRGEPQVVADTLAREFKKLVHIPDVISGRIRWNSKVYFVNTADYAAEVDQGLGPKAAYDEGYPVEQRYVRPDNLYYGKVFMFTRAKLKYPELK